MIGPPSSSLSRLPNILTPNGNLHVQCGLQMQCGICHKTTNYMNESSVQAVPANVAVQRVIQVMRLPGFSWTSSHTSLSLSILSLDV